MQRSAAAGQPLTQPAGTNYGDGISSLTTTMANGQTLPGPRNQQPARRANGRRARHPQRIGHELRVRAIRRPRSGSHTDQRRERADHRADRRPQFDPDGTGTQTLAIHAQRHSAGTGTSTTNPLDQPTVVTSYLDLSQIYGSDADHGRGPANVFGRPAQGRAGGSLPQDVPSVAVANLDGSTQFNPRSICRGMCAPTRTTT